MHVENLDLENILNVIFNLSQRNISSARIVVD